VAAIPRPDDARDGGHRDGSGKLQSGLLCRAEDGSGKGVPVEIVGPGSNGEKDKRLLSLSESTKAQTFQFPSQGFFDIRRANGREELASVNADRRESDFAFVPAETLELWKNTGVAPTSGQPGSRPGSASASQLDDKAELWPWVLVMLAILAIAESVLGNRHITVSEKGEA